MNTRNLPGFTADASLGTPRGRYRTRSRFDGPANGRGRVVAQRQRNEDIWTTDKICEACGCTVKGFACDCGLRPSPSKLECIRNGGPVKRLSVLARAF
jgi:hypothetical protein